MTNTKDSTSPIDDTDGVLSKTFIEFNIAAKRLAAKLRQSTKNQKEGFTQTYGLLSQST